MTKGIVLCGPDKGIQERAKRAGLGIAVSAEADSIPFEKALFVETGTVVPWDLLPAAWHFLDRWDAAVPLWRYGKTAEDVGTPSERTRTKAVVRDLRILLHAWELLFVRNNDAGNALIRAFREEQAGDGDKRLAFLRAMYRVKPRVCVLPLTWTAEVGSRPAGLTGRNRKPRGKRLVQVEVGPGRFVQCHPGDEEKVKTEFARRQGRRR